MDSQQNLQIDGQQTLHDFVLNLLTDADARSAFELDPEGTLQAAGLGDITAADVQDVVPLVLDYAPAQGITNLPQLGDLTGVTDLGVDATDAIAQLQSVTQQLALATPSPSVETSAYTLGAITVDSTVAGNSVGLGLSGAAGLSSTGDVAYTLDATAVTDLQGTAQVVPDVTVPATPVTPDVAGLTDGLPGTDSLLSPLGDVAGLGNVAGLGDVAGLGNVAGLGDVTGLVDSVGAGGALDSVAELGGEALSGVPSAGDLLPDLSAGLTGAGAGSGTVSVDNGGLTSGLTGSLTGEGNAQTGLLGGGNPLDLGDGLL